MNQLTKNISLIICLAIFTLFNTKLSAQSYKIVDTGQEKFYNNSDEITTPSNGESFYGQDAQFTGNTPSYTNNNDGTISDNVTGLMWTKTPDLNGDGVIDINDKLSYSDALATASTLSFAGYSDWRLPNIKEQYSLIMFYGLDPSGYNGSSDALVPFMNTDYFDFGYGDEANDERIIDAQFASSTKYVSTTMNGDETMFGVNLADGRIKGYPTGPMPGGTEDKGYYILYVRANSEYGINDFVDNGNNTITDNATNLMWTQNDNGEGVNWEDALTWVNEKNTSNYLGYNDWRLPNVKELQSIVDYSRSPATTNTAAIDPLFNCTSIIDEGGSENYPFYWSSTTHENMVNGSNAAYLSFGEALGWMEMPPNSGSYTLLDVHGAGSQRSDPKIGSADSYPYGHGPQGDVIRINNYVRLVRDANVTGIEDSQSDATEIPNEFRLNQNYPNPFNPSTTISFEIPSNSWVSLKIYNTNGEKVASLIERKLSAGNHEFSWNANNLSSGIYFYTLVAGNILITKQMILLK
ncbi:MAG: DUF1566 domain-containing protein [Ignavibacteriae bacterium]|nr:DUF1566 domain-containing protein [Ignavibacteriota bacterium]